MKLRYCIIAIFTIVYVTDTKSMNAPQKLDLVDISAIHKSKNKKEIWYKADLFSLDGSKVMVGHKYKIDTEKRKAGDITCWQEVAWQSAEIMPNEYFEVLEKEYKRRKNK